MKRCACCDRKTAARHDGGTPVCSTGCRQSLSRFFEELEADHATAQTSKQVDQ